MVRIDKNFRNFLLKVVIFVGLIFLSRVAFQFPIEYFNLKVFQQSSLTRLFSKIDALQVITLLSIFFGLYYNDRISKLEHPKPKIAQSILLVLGAEVTIAAYYLIRASANYYSITSGIQIYLIQLAILVSLGLAFLLFLKAVFSEEYLKIFFKEFKKEVIIFTIIAVLLYNALITFQKQWLLFSSGITTILSWMLSLFYSTVSTSMNASGGPILRAEGFGVSIGPPCSGIDSMLLFFAFFAALFALDRKIIRKGLYAIFFLIGLAGVYVINVLRLFLLMLAGIYISPRFAVGLFHTNAGWVLFVLYFLLYYWFIRKFIYKKEVPKNTDRKEKNKILTEGEK
jgi:exosortase/archaeosortase family protein